MSEKNKISALFDRSGNLRLETMQQYLDGSLSPEEVALVEKHLEESPFDREAMEGMRREIASNVLSDVDALKGRISFRAGNWTRRRRRQPAIRAYYIAAAGLLAILTLTALLFFMFRNTMQAPEFAISRSDSTLEEAMPVISPVIDTLVRQVDSEQTVSSKEFVEEKETEEIVKEENHEPLPPTVKKIAMAEDIEPEISNVEDFALVDESIDIAAGSGLAGEQENEEPKVDYTISTESLTRTSSKRSKQLDQEMIMYEEVSQPDSAEIFMVVDKMPVFPGGDKNMYKFLAENLQYPDSAKASGIAGTVYLGFIVEKDGTISDIRALRSPDSLLSNEAMRVVKAMPKWHPGIQRGKPVRVQYNLPIKFSLE